MLWQFFIIYISSREYKIKINQPDWKPHQTIFFTSLFGLSQLIGSCIQEIWFSTYSNAFNSVFPQKYSLQKIMVNAFYAPQFSGLGILQWHYIYWLWSFFFLLILFNFENLSLNRNLIHFVCSFVREVSFLCHFTISAFPVSLLNSCDSIICDSFHWIGENEWK